MGRRIPTIPFSGGKPLPGHDFEREHEHEIQRIDTRVRAAAREIERALDTEVKLRPKVALAVTGAACALLGVFAGKPLVRLALVGLGGYALFHFMRGDADQSVKGMLP